MPNYIFLIDAPASVMLRPESQVAECLNYRFLIDASASVVVNKWGLSLFLNYILLNDPWGSIAVNIKEGLSESWMLKIFDSPLLIY